MGSLSRRIIVLALVVVTGCGGNDAATTTTTTAPLDTSTTTTTLATTTTVDTGPLAPLLAAPVEDPLFGTGYHTLQYVDEDRGHLVSERSLTGADPEVERLAIGPLESVPAVTGAAPDQMLVSVWVDNWAGDPMPTAVTLYTRGAAGWTAYATLRSDEVVAFLETTTDYAARRPAGTPLPLMIVTEFDWAGGTARVVAGVAVFSSANLEAPAAFEGQIECTIAATLDCALLSDDGVLRPGDEGDAVTMLQEGLIALGYLSAPATGVYDDTTTAGVREFQRDHRLARDAKAGPQTLGVLAKVLDGSSTIVMASRFGIGAVLVNTEASQAITALQGVFGVPEVDTGWYVDACDGYQWRKLTWGGFTAVLTDRAGSRRLDGWHVDDMADLPSWLYFKGGFRPGTTWAYVKGLPGAGWGPDYGGVFRVTSQEYDSGRFVVTPTYPSDPPDSAVVQSFGTGTGAFLSC